MSHADALRLRFEKEARDEKVRKLTEVLDRAFREQMNLDPARDGDEIALRLSLMSEASWLAAARAAHCNYPSPKTQAAVIETYRERARFDREVAS